MISNYCFIIDVLVVSVDLVLIYYCLLVSLALLSVSIALLLLY